MNEKELKKLLEKGEGQNLDFTSKPEDVGKTKGAYYIKIIPK
ncbi:MAG: hypothetical protein QMC85_06815 [Methanocellales archaeon]|nr:hypothetical protein [Methanocellales archaeon]